MNPDTHLLYEYMNKLPFTVRMKVRLDQPVDAVLLNQAAQEAIVRFPYFSVRVGLDESQSYALEHSCLAESRQTIVATLMPTPPIATLCDSSTSATNGA